MKISKLNNMTKGWFIGDFEPTLFPSRDFEVGFKSYVAGTIEPMHHHKISTEFTLIASGSAKMNGTVLTAGDIVEIAPNVSTNFEAITDCSTVVVKIPSSKNDKYLD